MNQPGFFRKVMIIDCNYILGKDEKMQKIDHKGHGL